MPRAASGCGYLPPADARTEKAAESGENDHAAKDVGGRGITQGLGLPDLLADLAAERLRPETEPADSGDARADLLASSEQYAEEISSVPGRAMIRDVLYPQDRASALQCCEYTAQQIATIAARATRRGQAFPSVDQILDGVVAPILYAILFRQPCAVRVDELVDRVLGNPSASCG